MQPAILTASGRWIDFVAPDPQQIFLVDIADALANIKRFTGHSPMSVADHSLLVADLVECDIGGNPGAELMALMHDAHEAFTGDISSPMKSMIGEDRVAEIENRVREAIFESLGLLLLERCSAHLIAVKTCDMIALEIERRLFFPEHENWPAITRFDYPQSMIPKIRALEKSGRYPGGDWLERVLACEIAMKNRQ